ncbi:MAG: 50S ribosomal protein L15 [bacterium]
MRLQDLKPAKGAKKRRKIVGRGPGSGHGLSATRGTKGQKSRSGTSISPRFEGGQMPLVRRIPKRGFKNYSRQEYAVVNVSMLAEKFEAGSDITPDIMVQKKLVKMKLPIKLLGDGEINKAFNIKVHAFSKSAEEKVKKAGGTIAVIK